MYIRAYGPTVSSRDREIPRLRTGTNTLAGGRGGGGKLYNISWINNNAKAKDDINARPTLGHSFL
jgi:hypothetical protein